MSWVDWDEKAYDELADIWVSASPDERDVLGKIVEGLNRELEADPLDVGESRQRNVRVVVRLPLTIWFRVSDDALLVRVGHVHRVPKRK